MKRLTSLYTICIALLLVSIILFARVGVCEAQSVQKQRIKIGFLIHDLVSERWKKDIEYFTNRVKELGGAGYYEMCIR